MEKTQHKRQKTKSTEFRYNIRNTEEVRTAIERFNQDALIIALAKTFGTYDADKGWYLLELVHPISLDKLTSIKYIRIQQQKNDPQYEPYNYRNDILYGVNSIVFLQESNGKLHSTYNIDRNVRKKFLKSLTRRAENIVIEKMLNI